MLLLLPLALSGLRAGPVPQAHAHNDYQHPRPLLDALSQGFCSVEADVFLVGDELLVGHDEDELRADRTLRSLYLDPLQARVDENHGQVGDTHCDFTLLIDVKSEAVAAWHAVSRQLKDYREMLTVFDESGQRKGAVTVVISGNRAASELISEPFRLAGLDGRLSDLSLGLTPNVMPWISDDFTRYFDWRGDGDMPSDQRETLLRFTAEAHRLGYRLRFWATPDRPSLWKELADAGVDLIGSDDLESLSRFLLRLKNP